MSPSSVICDYQRNRANQALEAEAARARTIQRLPSGTLQTGSGSPGSSIPTSPAAMEKQRAVIDITSTGDSVIVAGSPGYRLHIHQLSLWNVAAQTITLKDSGDILPLQGALTDFPATSGYVLPDQGEEPHFILTDGGNFVINLSGSTQVSGFVRYRAVPA